MRISLARATFFSALFYFLLCCQTALANGLNPALYLIEKNGQQSYLFGTVHMGDQSMAVLPEKVTQALKSSDQLVVEVDLSQLTAAQLQARAFPLMLLPEGQTLASRLDPSHYEKLANYLQSQGMDITQVQRLQPWAVMIELARMAYMRAGYMPEYGVDMQLLKLAKQLQKPVLELETIEQQFGLFSRLGEFEGQMIDDALAQLNDANKYIHPLIYAWQRGDNDGLASYHRSIFGQDEYTKRSEQILLTERNRAWVTTLVPKLKQHSLFIAVGALHLTEQQGLLELLKINGFKIKKV
ncbi:TraB/GumN family protein [Pseudoalteromonas fenneropenaei]|uniref:TraB/GumN family protein n=1 Tax=Pseudoalteromonas fenneropenaei TaxID=1737459 RepID=A0ABV7CK47_9GAMM